MGLSIVGIVVLLAAIYFVVQSNSDNSSSSIDGVDAQSPASNADDNRAQRPESIPETDSLPRAASSEPEQSAHVLPQLPNNDIPPAEATLWELDASNSDAEFEGLPAKRVDADPELITQLHVGQTLHLPLPHTQTTVTTELTSTHNQSAAVNVWRGDLLGGVAGENVIITRGPIETHVIISTESGTFNAIIDNASGRTLVVDAGDVSAGQVPEDDGIYIEPVEQEPPP